MISLVVTAIVTVCAALFRGALSIVVFLLKLISRVVRLLFSVLPVTGIALLLTCVHLVVFSFTGTDMLPETLPFHPDGRPFLVSFGSMILLLGDLRKQFPGILSILLLIAAVILCVPVILSLLIAHAFIAILPVLPVLLGAEIAVLIVFGIFTRKTPFTQIRDRYYFLFPKRADRHYERTYHAWLKRHAGEFEDDTFGGRAWDGPQRQYADEEADDGEWEESPRDRGRNRHLSRTDRKQRQIEDYYEEYDDDRDDRYADDDEDGDYDEDDGFVDDPREAYDDERRERDGSRHRGERRANFFDFGDDEGEERREERRRKKRGERRTEPGSVSSFDFFAGCRDLAGVEKKYRSLVKIYHPDNQDGDTSAIQEINAQYAEAKRRFR
ncbi:MAG: J domain-containing protein [Lachnospiraceae bacterium]|nr:J domain-containing protein [Lachnospiraceae bacterium]